MFTATLLTVSVALTGASADPIARSLNDYLDRIAGEGASGVALVAVGDEVKLRRGFGHADCAATRTMTPDHLVLMGSITKELTQLLTYVLVEEEKLAFEETIGSYFPTLPEPLAAVTVRQLVDHTGGLPDLIDAEGKPVPYSVEYDYLPVSRDEMMARAAKSELLFAPGAREEYSNLGYGVLGALLEVASEESYEALLASRIFAPAGMSSTGYVFPDPSAMPFAEGCRGATRWGSPLLDGMWGSGGASWNLKAAGGLLTTVDDLSRWFGGLRDGLFLGAEMHTRYLDERLARSKLFAQRVMGPAGSNGIFNAVAYWAEASDLRVVVVTTNSAFQAERERIARTLIRTAADYVLADTNDQP